MPTLSKKKRSDSTGDNAKNHLKGFRFDKKGTFRGIRLEAALKELISPSEEIFGYQSVLFEGVKAWLLNSQTHVTSKYAMIREVARLARTTEKTRKTIRVYAGYRIMSFKPQFADFYLRIYDVVGGMSAIVSALKRNAEMARQRKASVNPIKHLVAMAHVWDFHQRELASDKNYGNPSIEISGRLAHRLPKPYYLGAEGSKTRGESTVWQDWSEHYRALSLLYGASLVYLESGETLLESLLAKKLTLELAAPHFSDWLGCANYLADEIIKKLPLRSKKGEEKRFPKFDFVELKEPAIPKFSDKLMEEIKTAFSQKKPSEKVVRHP